MIDFGDLESHFRKEGALAEAQKAFEDGRLEDALGWLEMSEDGQEKRQLASEVHYALAKRSLQRGKLGEALEDLSKAPRDGAVPPFLLEERQSLIRNHRGQTLNLWEFSTCSECEDQDLYVVATCGHQRDPMTPATKISRDAYRPDIHEVYAAAAYRSGWDPRKGEAASTLIRHLKTQVNESALSFLSEVLAAYILNHTRIVEEVDIIVPIPSIGGRYAKREGSLPDVIARTLSEEICIPVRDALVAQREPRSHAELNRSARRLELEDAWCVADDPIISGRVPLVVDDITTSGTTLRVAGQKLKSGGARAVFGAALFHTEYSN